MITLGSALLVMAAVLAALGALTWPPGGLLFALPFLFLMPAAVLGVIGGMVLCTGPWRKRVARDPATGAT
jgi:hypothetical protein